MNFLSKFFSKIKNIINRLVSSIRPTEKKAEKEAELEEKRRRIEEMRPLRPITPKMWRLTIAINYVIHSKYFSMRLQAWSLDYEDLLEEEDKLKEILLQELENELGYPREEWWFDWELGVGYQLVPFDPDLVGTIDIENEFLWEK